MPKIRPEPQLDFNNVLIEPQRSHIASRSKVFLERLFNFKHSTKSWEGIPIVAANMDTTGTLEVAKVLEKNNMLTALHKFYKASDLISSEIKLHRDMFMISTGISDTDLHNLQMILQQVECSWICIDVANGYMDTLIEFTNKVRSLFPDKIIVAGNVVTKERVEELILYGGVDIVKVGIGPGSACTTRIKTGVGVPQFSAILECAEAAHKVGGHIMADGGITCPGDMAKAFGAGADFVMMGGVFAGHDESPGQLIVKEVNGVEKKFKLFYGMSSTHAMNTFYGGKNSYRASEGKVVEVPYRGKLNDTLEDYLGGLRSTCTYIGAKCIKHMSKCTTFVLVGQQLNNVFK